MSVRASQQRVNVRVVGGFGAAQLRDAAVASTAMTVSPCTVTGRARRGWLPQLLMA